MLQALAIQRELGLKFEEAEALNSLGWAYFKFDPQVSLDYFNQSLDIYRQLGDDYMQAFELANIGDDYRVLGDYRKAIDSFTQTLPLLHSAGPGPAAAIAEAAPVVVIHGHGPRPAQRPATDAIPVFRLKRQGEGTDHHEREAVALARRGVLQELSRNEIGEPAADLPRRCDALRGRRRGGDLGDPLGARRRRSRRCRRRLRGRHVEQPSP